MRGYKQGRSRREERGTDDLVWEVAEVLAKLESRGGRVSCSSGGEGRARAGETRRGRGRRGNKERESGKRGRD